VGYCLGGYGGTGLATTISGYQQVFGGGGAGGGTSYQYSQNYYPKSYAHGGAGGGGNSSATPQNQCMSQAQSAWPGILNTGGGAGAAAASPGSNAYAYGANGGSGIVILRYPSTYAPPANTINAMVSYAGNYQIYTWITSGSITF